MAHDFLDQLAQLEVHAPPPDFDRQLHQRLNRSLLGQHLLDLLLGALPWAFVHFARGCIGAIVFTATGRFTEQQENENP